MLVVGSVGQIYLFYMCTYPYQTPVHTNPGGSLTYLPNPSREVRGTELGCCLNPNPLFPQRDHVSLTLPCCLTLDNFWNPPLLGLIFLFFLVLFQTPELVALNESSYISFNALTAMYHFHPFILSLFSVMSFMFPAVYLTAATQLYTIGIGTTMNEMQNYSRLGISIGITAVDYTNYHHWLRTGHRRLRYVDPANII